jgi:uncharacterized membrane protein YeaQ/YmgE (transglycosylase-associated protein family)
MIAEMHLTFGSILVYIVAGLIIGAIARLLVPGRQSMGLLATMIIGVVGAVVGGILWNAIFPSNDGIAWIGSIVVAAVLVFLYAGATSNNRSLT